MMSEKKYTRDEWRKFERDEHFLNRIRKATVGYRIDSQELYSRVLAVINEIVLPGVDVA